MIVKIDHVAIASTDFEKQIEAMESLSYTTLFVEKNIKNLQIKRNLMSSFSGVHDVALLTSSSNLGIELINHGHISDRKSNILPIFENIPHDLIIEKGEEKRFYSNTFIEVKLKGLNVPAYCLHNTENGSFRFNKVIMKTTDVEKSIAFWECLGFRALKKEVSFALLKFKPPLASTSCSIYLQKDESVNKLPFLDDPGCNCIAFISNAAQREKEILDKKGFFTSDIEKFSINEKLFNILFATGHCGELIEIITVEKLKV